MNVGELFGRHWVAGDKTPSPDWEMTGEVVNTPQGPCPVYRETLPNLKRVPRTINGEVQWLKHPTTGAKLWIEMEHMQDEKEPYITRDFILWDLGNGMTVRNYDFRSSPADEARKAARDQLTPEVMLDKFVSMQAELEQLRDKLNAAEAFEPGELDEEPTLE